MARHSRDDDALGFSLIDLLATLAVFATMSAAAVPLMQKSLDSFRLGMAARNVERELQAARLAAVSSNQPMRVRFNCPATGQYRIVELIGTPSVPATDDGNSQAATRCGYPYPASDRNPLTRPNHDGPIQRLDTTVSFGSTQTIEFWPDGTAHASAATNPWPVIGTAGVTLTLTKGSTTKSIAVNGVGKIQLQ